MDEINLLLQEAAAEQLDERLEADYQVFLEDMYYFLECDQWERDHDLFNELG
jgi:hypothetical protein